jgi:hypothetical protein
MPASSDAGTPLQGPKCTWGQTTSALLSLQVRSWLYLPGGAPFQQLVLNMESSTSCLQHASLLDLHLMSCSDMLCTLV